MFHYIHTLIMFKTLTLESIFEYICQKWKKKHAHFKISSRDDVFTHLFLFFHPGTIFHPYLFDREESIPGWNFISVKTCKQWETFHHRQGWFHSGMKSSLPLVKYLLLFTRFCRNEISSRDELISVKKTGMKFHPGMKIRKKDV